MPNDTAVLTLGCGKFRFFDRDLGAIDGVPRLLDMGQCNDAYSAIVVATALSKSLSVGINDLPLSLVVSTIMCEIILCHIFHKWQVGGNFTYGFRPPVDFHL